MQGKLIKWDGTTKTNLAIDMFIGVFPEKSLVKDSVLILDYDHLKLSLEIGEAIKKNPNGTFKKLKRRGGKRINSGKEPKKYPVKQMGMRVPLAVFELCNEACRKISKKYEINFEKSLRNQK